MDEIETNEDSAALLLRPIFSNQADEQACAADFFLQTSAQIAELIGLPAVEAHTQVRYLRSRMPKTSKAALGRIYQPVVVALSILCDLFMQGWSITVTAEGVKLERPPTGMDRETERQRVRQALSVARDEQLSE